MIKSFKKKCLVNFCLIGASLAFSAGAQAQTLKLGHVTPPTHVWHQVAEKIDENVQKNSGGKFKVDVNPLSKLGSEGQMVNLLQSGAMPLGILTGAFVANREESLLGWSLPYLFDDVEDATKATELDAAQEMLKNLDKQGLVGLGYVFAGMRHILSTEPIASPEDLKNKKIRAFPSPLFNDWWNANGAAPTAMPLSEVAPSLTTNLLNVVDVDLDALVGMKLHQQAPYLSLTNQMAFIGVIVASKRYWERLDADQQEMLLKSIKDAEKWGFQRAIDADVNNLVLLKEDGIKIQEIDLQPFMKIGEEITQKYIESNSLRAKFYKEVNELKN